MQSDFYSDPKRLRILALARFGCSPWGVTTLPRPKLARVLVFFGVLNLMHETDCIIWVQGAHSTLAKGGVSSLLDSFVLAESSVHRTNFCAKKPAHRQSAKR
jgi:hypothetical protein